MSQEVSRIAENLFIRYISRSNFLPSLRDEDVEESKDGYFVRKGHNHYTNIRDCSKEDLEKYDKRFRIVKPFAERVAREAIEDAQIFHAQLKEAFNNEHS